MQARRFLGLVFGLCATAGALVAGMNWLFDPTGLLQAAGYRQSAACTRGLRGNDATVRGHAAVLAQAKTLLVGTSQVAIGFDPAALPPRWADGGGFNLGISGATLQTLTPLLPTLLDASSPARVVLGLSPAMVDRATEHAEAAPGIGSKGMLLVAALMSGDATFESLRLWFERDACRNPDTRPDGLRFYAPTSDQWRRPETLAILIDRMAAPGARPQWRRDLDALLSGVCRPEVQVFIILTPHHADWQLAYWAQPAAWSKIEQFKRDVTEAAAHAAQNGCAIPVYDFNIVSGWTTSHPAPGRPFVDYVHFQPAIGRRILELLASDATHHQGAGDDSGNGRQLTPETLNAHLASQRAILTELAGRSGSAPDTGRRGVPSAP